MRELLIWYGVDGSQRMPYQRLVDDCFPRGGTPVRTPPIKSPQPKSQSSARKKLARIAAEKATLGGSEAVKPEALTLADYRDAMKTVLPTSNAYEMLRCKSAEALKGRVAVLCALNAAVFQKLLPWADLSESGSVSSLAHDLCSLRPLLFSAPRRSLFDRLMSATNTRSGRTQSLEFDRFEAASAKCTAPPQRLA